MHVSRNNRVTLAGVTFVLAWLVGLVIAPPAPDMTAAASEISSHYRQHGPVNAAQSLLIHGVAGVALMVLGSSLSLRRFARAAGMAAGLVSLFQAGVGVGLSSGAAAGWFDVLNIADTAKLVFVGAFIWTVARGMPPRLARVSQLIASLQVVAGTAFVTGSASLYSLLYMALPALLIWAGVVAFRAMQRDRDRVLMA